MKTFQCFTGIIIILLVYKVSYADDVSKRYFDLREKEIYEFSLDLFQQAEYYRAITEAKRYVFLFPQGKNAEDMYKLIGDAYLMAREWSDAIDAYNTFIKNFPDSQYINQILFNKAICLVKKMIMREQSYCFKR
jgi:TolA-binding protein